VWLPNRARTAVTQPDAISGQTALVGVLGDPVRHSLSPAMQNAALRAMGLDWVFLALPAPPERFQAVVDSLETLGCRGLNVTIPHKQAACAVASDLSPLAARLGAVNTLVPRAAGGWFGTNTDVEGFCAPLLQDGSAAWQGRRAVVLGCGGSARAVVAGLVELGCSAIGVAGRDPARLEAFAADCRAWAPQLQPLDWRGEAAALERALQEAALVVNTTPVGMRNANDPTAPDRCSLSAAQLDRLDPGATVYDLIYTPRPTRLLQEAAGRGCRTVDGVEMLVQQGAAALRLWSGRDDVPVATMRQALLEQLP
jgi:shikimate dehydrogenase